MLADLTAKDKSLHLIHSPNDVVYQYTTDVLKETYGIPRENILDVNNRRTINTMNDWIPIDPHSKWLFLIDYEKTARSFQHIQKAIRLNPGTSVFSVRTKKYPQFKRVQEAGLGETDHYLSFLRYHDTKWALRDSGIKSNLLSFISYSYGSSPESIIELAGDIEKGAISVPQTRADVINQLGYSAGTTTQLALKLMQDVPISDRSRKALMRNRLTAGRELIESYGIRKFRNYLYGSFKDILDVKVLYMNNAIYNKIGTKLPEGYDPKRLRRYQRHIEEIKEISLERILWYNRVIKETGPWNDENQYQDFLYRLYLTGPK